MGKSKTPRWTAVETAILCDIYPKEGLPGASDALPDRSWQAIYQRAHQLQLSSPVLSDAPKCALQGDRLERAIKLREEDKWSFARIAATLGGISEAGCCNAVMAALCARKGFRPAARDATGRLLPEEFDRLRLMLRKGLKGIDIQLRMGVSAGRVSLERRRYNRELKTNGKALLPPPGGGEAYSGVKVPRAKKLEVEQLFLAGLGTLKISQRTGVSKTVCTRVRNKLIARLGRKGEILPGCDEVGRRRRVIGSIKFITPDAKERFRTRLLEGESVQSAARAEVIGGSSAYRFRDELVADLAARGEQLPPPTWRGRGGQLAAAATRAAQWQPRGPKDIYRFRELCLTMTPAEAKGLMMAEIEAARVAEVERRRAERAKPKTFAEQMERLGRGEVGLRANVPIRRAMAEMTLGGVSAAM